MTTKLFYDFIVDKQNNTLTIKREFAGSRQLVWDCHTKQAHLDKWFAPKPFSTKTKSMDFSEGGHWHYAMIDPDGKEYWGLTDYIKIKAIDFYEALDAFSDSDGNVNKNLPQAKWHVHFYDKEENTQVETTVNYKSLKDLEAVINMGMEAGMMSTMERLDELLLTLTK
jgi:uncharacterized protein YndB with AHSA1/START domain